MRLFLLFQRSFQVITSSLSFTVFVNNMYNLRTRVRVTSAGSARPHIGMGSRAPPTAASQVTPLPSDRTVRCGTVPESKMFEGNSDETRDVSENVGDLVEATQPPTHTRIQSPDLSLFSLFHVCCFGVCPAPMGTLHTPVPSNFQWRCMDVRGHAPEFRLAQV